MGALQTLQKRRHNTKEKRRQVMERNLPVLVWSKVKADRSKL